MNDDFLDREYNPRLGVADVGEIFGRWKRAAHEARERLHGQSRLGLQFGPTAPETLDFFAAPGNNRPLLIFVHGGYWRALHKDDASWVAPPYVAEGFSVAVINYGLAPTTAVGEIVEQIRRACAWLHRNADDLAVDPKHLVCSGHSAGGHLTAMMLATDWPRIAPTLPQRLLSGAVTISGLFDLVPVSQAPFLRDDLRLDEPTARELSPAFQQLHNDAPLLRAVGALETAEFHRQSELIAHHWPQACPQALIDLPGCNHFTAWDALSEPGSALFQGTAALLSGS